METTFTETDELTETADAAPFVIDSAERADWYLRKLANIAAEKARVKTQAAEMIRQLEADAAGLEYRFGSQLEAFARAELERRGGRRKSLPLFQGTLSFRSQPARVIVADESAALEFAQGAGFAVKTTLDAAEYRKEAQKRLQETGEAIPGIQTVAAAETFSVTFGKGKETADAAGE